MSRSIGDDLSHTIGVSECPEVLRFDLQPDHKFIVVASDGVWEFLSNKEIGMIVWPFYLINSPEQAGNAIVRAAAQKWREKESGVIDDITCITIFLEVDNKIPRNNYAHFRAGESVLNASSNQAYCPSTLISSSYLKSEITL